MALVALLLQGDAVKELLRKQKISESKIGISVYSVKSQSFVYQLNESKAFIPASNMKIVTTAAALSILGPDFSFATKLYVDQDDLVVLAGGDPNISGRDHDGDPTFLFKAWADKLAAKGIKSINDVRLVNALFDGEFVHPDWKGYDLTEWYTAPVGAFSLNDNCLDVTVTGGPKVSIVPDTRYVTLRNLLATGSKNSVAFLRRGSEITIKGEYPAKGTFTDNCTIDHPHQFFGTVLIETLRAKGIDVRGKLVEVNERVAVAPKGEPIDVFTSSLKRTLEVCNGNSQNFYAEMLLKQLGYRVSGYGTFASGVEVLQDYLKKLKVEDAALRDGSGLSKENRISAASLARVLIEMKDRKEFVDSLPVSAQTGTLRKRLKSLDGKVRAKTGHVAGVNTLSGYLQTGSGDTLIFSILANDATASNAELDAIIEALHGSF